MTKEVWYFTFCGRHKQRDCYVKFSGTYGEARDKMVDAFGEEWAFQYPEAEAEKAVHRFNLKEITDSCK